MDSEVVERRRNRFQPTNKFRYFQTSGQLPRLQQQWIDLEESRDMPPAWLDVPTVVAPEGN